MASEGFPESLDSFKKRKVTYYFSHHQQRVADALGRVESSGDDHGKNYMVGYLDDETANDLKKEGMIIEDL